MNIEFYLLSSGETVDNGALFVMGNEVWCDNYKLCESQSATVGFEDFVEKCPHIGWSVVST